MRGPARWLVACTVLDAAPGENYRGARWSAAQGTGAPVDGGRVGKGWETELPTPPHPGGLASLVSMPANAPTLGPERRA